MITARVSALAGRRRWRGVIGPAEALSAAVAASCEMHETFAQRIDFKETRHHASVACAQGTVGTDQFVILMAVINKTDQPAHRHPQSLTGGQARTKHDRVLRVAIGGRQAGYRAIVERTGQRREEFDRAACVAFDEAATWHLDAHVDMVVEVGGRRAHRALWEDQRGVLGNLEVAALCHGSSGAPAMAGNRRSVNFCAKQGIKRIGSWARLRLMVSVCSTACPAIATLSPRRRAVQ